MTVDYLINASIRSMIHGHHEPHYYRAWIAGSGYVNDGSQDRPDYLRRLEQSARIEADHLRYASAYAEPGYDQPRRGILFANWNVFPRALTDMLERLGYAIEWSDEWEICDDCDRAYRSQPDSHDWQPVGHYRPETDSCLCETCYRESL